VVNRLPGASVVDDARLAAEIASIHDMSRGTYGSPRVREELQAQGKPHGVNRVTLVIDLASRR
jgi:SOS response regulatory protein OraA/RecX